MKLAISNLSWDKSFDDVMFRSLHAHKIDLEVAPDRIFKWEESKISGRPVSPYERFEGAEDWYNIVYTHYRIKVASMHSLLYGVEENLFASPTYRRYLRNYLEKAVDFAVNIKCPNLSFGCAKNRNIPSNIPLADAGRIAVDFFGQLSEYAGKKGVCISIEALPESSGTNFINYTSQALDLARCINSPSFKTCLDLGTVLANNENLEEIITPDNISLINHVYISEPDLGPLKQRDIYGRMAELLKKAGYEKYVSIKMLMFPDVKLIRGVMNYMKTVFVE